MLRGKLLTKDAFSHSFSGTEPIATEWLVEVAYFLIYTKLSLLHLALISSLFTTLAFFLPLVFIRGDKILKFMIASWAVLGSANVLAVGARPQNSSLVFFSLLLLLLFEFSKKIKIIYLLPIPLLILIWANAHPAYLLGITLIFLFLLTEIFYFLIINKRRITAKKILVFTFIFGLSVAFSTIKPSGQNGINSLKDNLTLMLPLNLATKLSNYGEARLIIGEYLPPAYANVSGILFFMGLIYSVLLFIDLPLYDKNHLRNFLLLLGIIYFSTLLRRNVPVFFMLFIILSLVYSKEFLGKMEIDKMAKKFSILIPYLNLTVICIMIVVILTKIPGNFQTILKNSKSESIYCETLKYPCGAIEYIKKEKPKGNMFNTYTWGAYLVWVLRDYPVFMHGRFPDLDVLHDYQKVTSLSPEWEDILTKYQIGWMLLPRNEMLENVITMKGVWKEVYSDDRAIILFKN